MPPKKWEVTKKNAGGRSKQVAILSMERANLSKNVTHLSCVTASTASGDVEDTEKDISSVW